MGMKFKTIEEFADKNKYKYEFKPIKVGLIVYLWYNVIYYVIKKWIINISFYC